MKKKKKKLIWRIATGKRWSIHYLRVENMNCLNNSMADVYGSERLAK